MKKDDSMKFNKACEHKIHLRCLYSMPLSLLRLFFACLSVCAPRSGSCPSQLLQQVQPSSTEHRVYASTSQRVKHKERPSVLPQTARCVSTYSLSLSLNLSHSITVFMCILITSYTPKASVIAHMYAFLSRIIRCSTCAASSIV